MEYLLKLRVRKEDLADEIKTSLDREYGMRCEVTNGVGEVRIPGLDTTILGFNVRDLRTGNCAAFIAIGYEDDAKYRIYGMVYSYCPKCDCDYGFDFSDYCKNCGTRLINQI
jgi:hypothetical protein